MVLFIVKKFKIIPKYKYLAKVKKDFRNALYEKYGNDFSDEKYLLRTKST